jgi:hypothetical protein
MNGPYPIPSSQYYVGLQYGYIIIPSDVDRNSFIEQCYRWERVSVLSEGGGGVFHECYISREAIKDVEFPDDSTHTGSCVMFLTDIHSGHPMIFGVLSKEDESQLLREGYFKFSKTYQGSSVIISGDAKKGIMNLSVDGGDLTQLNITVSNKDKNATTNLRCRGDINLEMDGLLKVNKGTQAMVKGTELKIQLEQTNTYLKTDLYDAIYTALQSLDAVVPGVSAAFQAAMTGKSPGDYTNIKSVESFLD